MTTREVPPMMACGHAANAHLVDGDERVPCCVICGGLSGDDAAVTVVDGPDLTGRMAICGSHKSGAPYNPTPSATTLAFFQHLPNGPVDSYYCGCWGCD